MGFILLQKISLLFLLISAALFSTSFAGIDLYLNKSFKQQIESSWNAIRHDEVSEIHERLLKVKTNDYGRYDPAPALVKPPFKLIPN
ncbi:hypothetical protein DH2020_029556 [Rehmannia glutinosa]|uniref:Uncharacterized protein n=1 Tax=Rehmannia glutinosa TaxID=99300 RepID=A0ABR0VQ20_REHGL